MLEQRPWAGSKSEEVLGFRAVGGGLPGLPLARSQVDMGAMMASVCRKEDIRWGK